MRLIHPLLALLVAVPVLGDVVHLKDGTSVEGTVRRESGAWVLTDASGKVTRYEDDVVSLVDKTSGQTPAHAAQLALGSLRRSNETVTDAKVAIDRINKFIAQNKNMPASAEAAKDLEIWKDRLNRKLVKAGAAWLSEEERSALLGKSVAAIEKARDLLKQGKIREADEIALQLLSSEPNSPPGLYLRGLTTFKQGQIPQSKQCFERLRELIPDHAPTLNNLGVVLWQQRQYAAALALYELAMIASPGNRQVLDNTAEALNAIPPRESTATARVAKRFREQDADLAKELAAEGLRRWGATYLNEEQWKQVEKSRQKVEAKLDVLKSEFAKMDDRVRQIDTLIASNERAMAQMYRDRVYFDPATSQFYQLPLPSIYYDMDRENTRLRQEQAALATRLGSFRERARAIEQSESMIPAYTGQQRMIEVEGTPLVLPAKAKTSPATRPAGK